MKNFSYARGGVRAASSYVDFSELPLLCLRNFLFFVESVKFILSISLAPLEEVFWG